MTDALEDKVYKMEHFNFYMILSIRFANNNGYDQDFKKKTVYLHTFSFDNDKTFFEHQSVR